MAKYVIYSNTDKRVLNITDKYLIEEDGTIKCVINDTATVGYHISVNPAVIEITDEQFALIDISNLNDYVVRDNSVINEPETNTDETEFIPGADLNTDKAYMIAKSKQSLAEWLENNPYLHTDGKYYACTAEKQSLLNSNLASYERAKSVGIDYPLKWNSTGDECTEWEYTALLTLSLSIAAYVAPKVSKQQSIEIQIKACETTEEVYNVVINYDE